MPVPDAASAPADFTFASDNTAGVCPEAWAALSDANPGRAPSYGDDPWTKRARQLLCETFETECEPFFVFNGTAANALALSALCRSYQSIICHELAHADTDECGAPEFFTGGSKVIPLAGANGKLQPAAVETATHRGHGVHYHKPGALSLTQATELGTVYTPAELGALGETARRRGLAVHMDGARFANAAATLGERSGCRPADLTWRSGVDVLSLGGTKNGMLTTEVVVFFNRELARDFDYRVKQSGQLSSKMRFAAAQWTGMLQDGAWLRHAAHANRMARRLGEAIRALSALSIPGATPEASEARPTGSGGFCGSELVRDSKQSRAGSLPAFPITPAPIKLLFEPEANGVFVELPPAVAEALAGKGWRFYKFIGEHGYRLMCGWDTTPAEVDAFAADLKAVVGVRT